MINKEDIEKSLVIARLANKKVYVVTDTDPKVTFNVVDLFQGNNVLGERAFPSRGGVKRVWCGMIESMYIK